PGPLNRRGRVRGPFAKESSHRLRRLVGATEDVGRGAEFRVGFTQNYDVAPRLNYAGSAGGGPGQCPEIMSGRVAAQRYDHGVRTLAHPRLPPGVQPLDALRR